MRSIVKTLFIFLFLISLNSFAKEITIPSISVTEGADNYNLILDTKTPMQYKKGSFGENFAYYEIDNVNTKEGIPIFFENTKNIEGVSVQNISKGKIRINIKGKNADSTNFYTLNSKGEPTMMKEIAPINVKLDALYFMAILCLISTIFQTFKKSDKKTAKTYYEYNHEAILNNLKQRKIMRINDYKPTATNPISTNLNKEDLEEMTRKSA